MDFELSASEKAFRDEVHSWLRANVPAPDDEPEQAGRSEWIDRRRDWQRKLYEAGYVGINWPKEYGGRGATLMEQLIFAQEAIAARAPEPINVIGLGMGGPVIIAHGTEEQKQRYLGPMLSAEEIWCQGFSEPNAGSDLAGLRARAERTDGGWRITGQKTWSSGAHYADGSFLLARTDAAAAPHKGIGFFLVDMRQPGVEVRRIRQMTGGGEFSEIFLNDVFVEDRNLVGAPDEGWRIAMTTFGFERGGLANAARFERAVSALAELARARGAGASAEVRQRVAQARIEAHIFRVVGLRNLTRAQHGKPPGPEASMTKLFWSEMDKRLQETAIAVQGPFGALAPESPWVIEEGRWQYGWMWSQAETIYAGSSEIQRNILAERVLGLPRGR